MDDARHSAKVNEPHFHLQYISTQRETGTVLKTLYVLRQCIKRNSAQSNNKKIASFAQAARVFGSWAQENTPVLGHPDWHNGRCLAAKHY